MPLIVAIVLVAARAGHDRHDAAARDRLWTEPVYAHLRLGPDRVPDFAALLDPSGPRPTVLTYEDWSSLAWYETGVGRSPSCHPATRSSPSTRRRSPVTARPSAGPISPPRCAATRPSSSRRPTATARIASCWHGGARRSGSSASRRRWRPPGGATGTTQRRRGNGWDAVVLEPGATLTIAAVRGRPIDLEIRLADTERDPRHGRPRFRRPRRRRGRSTSTATPERDADFSVVKTSVDPPPALRCGSRRSTRSPSSRSPGSCRTPDRPPAGRSRPRPTTRSSGSGSHDPLPPPSARLGLDLDRAAGARRVALEGVGAGRPTRRRRPATDRRGAPAQPRDRGRLGRPFVRPAGRGRAARAGPPAHPDDRLREHHQQRDPGLRRRAGRVSTCCGPTTASTTRPAPPSSSSSASSRSPTGRERREPVADLVARPPADLAFVALLAVAIAPERSSTGPASGRRR